ncbi:MAG: hypothetical protein NT067_04135 [Candidatus Diapherotrites archaeon]|nr:hypothetical protein [Candidatus Diapherotrites archaeon]
MKRAAASLAGERVPRLPIKRERYFPRGLHPDQRSRKTRQKILGRIVDMGEANRKDLTAVIALSGLVRHVPDLVREGYLHMEQGSGIHHNKETYRPTLKAKTEVARFMGLLEKEGLLERKINCWKKSVLSARI